MASQLGQVGTQLDGLGHVGIGDVSYNGFDQRQFVTPKGLAKLGIEKVGVFFARGVLLDIALLKEKARLEKGYEVTDTDLKQALESQRIQINPGDCVFVHTGWGGLWETDHSQYTSGEPGIGSSAGLGEMLSLFAKSRHRFEGAGKAAFSYRDVGEHRRNIWF